MHGRFPVVITNIPTAVTMNIGFHGKGLISSLDGIVIRVGGNWYIVKFVLVILAVITVVIETKRKMFGIVGGRR